VLGLAFWGPILNFPQNHPMGLGPGCGAALGENPTVQAKPALGERGRGPGQAPAAGYPVHPRDGSAPAQPPLVLLL